MCHCNVEYLRQNPTGCQAWGKALAAAFYLASLRLGFSLYLQILFGDILCGDA